MAKTRISCPDCAETCVVTSPSAAPIQCCPFCGNTLLMDNSGEDDDSEDDGLREFDPEDED